MNETRFTRNPSALYMEAVEKLQVLLEAEGLDSVRRVYAEATHRHIKQRFKADRDLENETPGGKRRIGKLEKPPGDHFNGWSRDGRRAVLISQPYHLTGEHLLKLAMGAKVHGLDLRITADSYYFPGRALLVELWNGHNPWKEKDRTNVSS